MTVGGVTEVRPVTPSCAAREPRFPAWALRAAAAESAAAVLATITTASTLMLPAVTFSRMFLTSALSTAARRDRKLACKTSSNASTVPSKVKVLITTAS